MSEDKVQRAVQQAIKADRERHRLVMAMPEAKGRQKQAEALFATELDIEQIRDRLASAPTDAHARSEAIAKRAVAHHRGETPPGQKPTATTERVVAGMRARGVRSTSDQ